MANERPTPPENANLVNDAYLDDGDNANDADAVERTAANGETYEMRGTPDAQPYYLVSGSGDMPERVNCDELPDKLESGKAYASANEINAYQADDDTEKNGVDLTPSSVSRQAIS